MAGGQLVPHTLPDGRTVMVPDYLAKSPALSMPDVGARPPADPGRTAQLSLPGQGGGAAAVLGQLSPDFRQVQDFGASNPNANAGPLAMTIVPPTEDAEQRRKRQDAERAMAAAREAAGKKDPSKLKPVPKLDPRRESDVIAQTAGDFYGQKRGGAAAPPKVDPANLTPVVAEVKREVRPGTRLLPEQEWRLGLSERPKELYEVDPDVEKIWGRSTIGTEDPVMREKLTPLEKGANAAGAYARADFERQVTEQQAANVAAREHLAGQAQLLDENLRVIAERRNKIAAMQEAADRRMSEAESMEPRTKSEIWESKGGLGKVLGAISMAIGGYTQGLGRNGGKNPGWEMLNKFLDDEVEGERYRAEQRKKVGMNARNDLERAQALYGDLDMAALESKNRKLANVMAMTQNMMADRSLDAMAKQRGAEVYAAAQEQYLANKQQLFDQITGSIIKQEETLKPYGQVVQTATPKPVGGGGSGGITGDKLRGLSADVRKLAVKMPDGKYRFVRSEQERIPMQARLNNAGAMIQNLRQLQALRADKANTIPWTEKRGQIEAIGSSLLALGKSKDNMGTLDKGLLEFSAKRYGSPEQFNVVDSSIDGKLNENIRLLEDEVRKTGELDLDNGPYELTEGGVTPYETHD